MLAYTIGAEKSYDKALADKENPVSKIGRRPDYDGGCIWRTPEEADAFIMSQGIALGFTAAVYEVLLPTGWDTDVSTEPDPHGYHLLLNDALINRKVQVRLASL